MKRAAVAKIGSMDRQTLRDWVHRFNASTLQRFDNRMEMQQRDRRVPALEMRPLNFLVPTFCRFEGGRLRTWNRQGGTEL
jgi:hypothetical protein